MDQSFDSSALDPLTERDEGVNEDEWHVNEEVADDEEDVEADEDHWDQDQDDDENEDEPLIIADVDEDDADDHDQVLELILALVLELVLALTFERSDLPFGDVIHAFHDALHIVALDAEWSYEGAESSEFDEDERMNKSDDA